MEQKESGNFFRRLGGLTLSNGLVAVSLAGMLAAGVGWWHEAHKQPVEAASSVATAVPMREEVSGLPDFTPIVHEYGPAVVNIQVTTAGNHRMGFAADPDDPMFRFFRRFDVPIPQQSLPKHGEGSGFIISPDGVILTNAHVVDGASEVMVKLTDRRELKAQVVGVDKATDVAVLRVEAHGLPVAHLGTTEPVKVGEWVLAIGSPFGFENSATAGIVSAKARALPDEAYVPFIQTDVAVNPGNSGGPLFNLRGEVVGINSQIYSQTGGYQGLSFAIPIEVALKVKDQILHGGKVTRGRLGVSIQDLNQALAQSFGLKKPVGALVNTVEPGSPAQHAGIKDGDVILEVDGTPILSASDLPPLVASLQPGSTAVLTVWRHDGEKKINVKVGELVQEAMTPEEKGVEGGKLGLAVRPLTAEERRDSGLDGGLLVVEVTGPAARAGIQDGDVILALNGTPVRSVEALRDLANKAGPHMALLVLRDDAKLFIPLTIG